MVDASNSHKNENFNSVTNELQPDKKNTITRLMTNEFFFYTQQPLSMEQFENLQQKIFEQAKKQPENLHIVLGSFAVLTPGGKVMNIVPHIECGQNPMFNFVVKNNPSCIDPAFKHRPNVDINIHGENCLNALSININNDKRPLSFNSVFQCKTAGDAELHVCMDICNDHAYATASKALNKKLDNASTENPKHMPTQCSHIVLSNSIKVKKENSVGDVAQADPRFSRTGSLKINGERKVKQNKIGKVTNRIFGSRAHVYHVDVVNCSKLPADKLEKVKTYNSKIDESKKHHDEHHIKGYTEVHQNTRFEDIAKYANNLITTIDGKIASSQLSDVQKQEYNSDVSKIKNQLDVIGKSTDKHNPIPFKKLIDDLHLLFDKVNKDYSLSNLHRDR